MKGSIIYYPERQDEYGIWMPTGVAFLSSLKCWRHVLNLDIEWVIENLSPKDIHEHVLPQVPEGKIEAMDEENLKDMLRNGDSSVKNAIQAATENISLGGRVGGLHNFDSLILQDGES